jgi:hypothetical protein
LAAHKQALCIAGQLKQDKPISPVSSMRLAAVMSGSTQVSAADLPDQLIWLLPWVRADLWRKKEFYGGQTFAIITYGKQLQPCVLYLAGRTLTNQQPGLLLLGPLLGSSSRDSVTSAYSFASPSAALDQVPACCLQALRLAVC